MNAPRVLLLEDDPVVARFVADALAPLPLTLELASDLAAATAAADAGQALWLFDARLPDGLASTLLPELRARGLAVPALALTADDDAASAARLRAAGFAQVLTKPLTASELRSAVLARLPAPGPRWDDAAALAALGDADAVRTLRRLFLDELPGQRQAVLAACAAGDRDEAAARLHRLQAGCGFVGAAVLLQAARRLAAAPADPLALGAFGDAAAELLVAD